MSKHEHHNEICAHSFLKYCKACNVVYCEACHKEWDGHKHNYVYPYTQPWRYEPAVWTTTDVTDRTFPDTVTSGTCDHV